MFTIFLWRFNVTVTYPFLDYFRLEIGGYEFPAGINMNCLISCDIRSINPDSGFYGGYIDFKMMSVHGKVTSVPKMKIL